MIRNLFNSTLARGFTLIELLVAVGILAVLSSISYSAYKGITSSALEAKKRAEVDAIAKVLESKYDYQKAQYPEPTFMPGDFSTGQVPDLSALAIKINFGPDDKRKYFSACTKLDLTVTNCDTGVSGSQCYCKNSSAAEYKGPTPTSTPSPTPSPTPTPTPSPSPTPSPTPASPPIFDTASFIGFQNPPCTTITPCPYGPTWTHTVHNGLNRLLLAVIAQPSSSVQYDSPSSLITNFQWNATPPQRLTLLGCKVIFSQQSICFYSLLNPAVGTYNLTFDIPTKLWGQDSVAGAVSWFNVNQSAPFGVLSIGSGQLSARIQPFVNVVSTQWDLIVDAVGANGNASDLAFGPGQNLLFNTSRGKERAGMSYKTGVAGTTKMSDTYTGGFYWTQVGVALHPAQ